MAAELIWTIVFGLTATAIGLVTIWQNFWGVHVEAEVSQRPPYRTECWRKSSTTPKATGNLTQNPEQNGDLERTLQSCEKKD
ncbi:uncharacterized protein Z520_09191 [Fonsecaea multimorphosa CBS 102226]|uniref:Uncharacterized protein n=1 Tax=Fonsecaea multimorphosa CBS 102226 TaxID=1442371 RepID=A0A0D2JXM0_9EURO|nr:uncharacterized protein Z520_09191 [Fonsecaea multimorphosa CBS 102226]KIX95274.1 hypothetical protein Z520_09191 [Fonsecaea multimorphosa CBS 102226]